MTSPTSKVRVRKIDETEIEQAELDFLSRSPAGMSHDCTVPLRAAILSPLIASPPLPSCRVSVIVPVRNEAENLPGVIASLAHQIDSSGNLISPACYEVLVLANNCTDSTVKTLRKLQQIYPFLSLQVVDVALAKEEAHVGKARQMIMDEAYRRFSQVGLPGRIIASTDGDTEVAPNWISALMKEFDKGIDAVGGRIITRRDSLGMSPDISLYYLRRLAHAYFASQIECLLDPQPHDCWPRHFQYCGANMAVSAEMYGKVGGMPLVRHEEDVALYRRLQRADAKIRHSLDVRVLTSARLTGRATGGLSELLETLSATSEQRQAMLVESPNLTEARILLRRQLRQIWNALQCGYSDRVSSYAKMTKFLCKGLGLSAIQLCQQIETASTFGELLISLAASQKEQISPQAFALTTEISLANMHLRQRLQLARQFYLPVVSESVMQRHSQQVVLQALQQVQSIPLFPSAYQ